MSRPLSELQRKVLLALLEEGSMAPNVIGGVVGAKRIQGGRGGGGRGQGHRSFGLAQQIIPPLNGLRQRGMVSVHRRADGRSGSEYSLTPWGCETAEALKEER